jgi:hypothetical protein
MNNYRDSQTGQFVKTPATRSIELTKELYRAFDFFNKHFTDNKLPKVVITIQESGRRNALGWFGNGFWRDSATENSVPEINLSAEYLSRSPEGILETVLHEMAHLMNAVNDIRDCSSGQYHNKHFKKAAEEFGLIVKRTGNKGWAYTSLGEEASKAIKQFKPKKDVFSNLRRRSISGPVVKKYISLIVSAEHEDLLAAAVGKSSMSQKEFVEMAVVSACNAVLGSANTFDSLLDSIESEV